MDKQENTVRQKHIIHIKRAFGIIHKLSPAYMPLGAAHGVLAALTPVITLYVTSLIINELSGARDTAAITRFAAAAVITVFVCSAGQSVIKRRLKVIEAGFQHKLYMFLGERHMEMEIEQVEKGSTNELLTDIIAKSTGNALGVVRQFLLFQNLVKYSCAVAASGVLAIGMFKTGGAIGGGFISTPAATVVLGAAVLALMLLALLARKNEQAVLKDIFDRNPKTNLFFHYYGIYTRANNAAKDIRLYNQKGAILRSYAERAGLTVWHEYFNYEGRLDGLETAANALSAGIVYLFIGLRALAGMYGIGSVVRYVGAITNLTASLGALAGIINGLRVNTEFLELLYKYLDIPDTKYKGTLTTEKRTDNNYEIEFRNVSFKYPSGNEYAVKDLSLKFKVGSRMAVVGMNGSGKTTMIKLLCRLHDPTEGTITLNGIDIKKYDYDEYISLFSVVFQDFKLLGFPLGQNVAANVRYDAARVFECLNVTGFGERLADMPNRLNTYLNKEFEKDGVSLSGGEEQKAALARALYKNTPFIVLDEPTAALDPIAEYDIYSRFDEIARGRTAVYISHRLSSCRFCDDIVVFHEGKLVQRGSHDALVSDKAGKYYELWNAQAQYYTE